MTWKYTHDLVFKSKGVKTRQVLKIMNKLNEITDLWCLNRIPHLGHTVDLQIPVKSYHVLKCTFQMIRQWQNSFCIRKDKLIQHLRKTSCMKKLKSLFDITCNSFLKMHLENNIFDYTRYYFNKNHMKMNDWLVKESIIPLHHHSLHWLPRWNKLLSEEVRLSKKAKRHPLCELIISEVLVSAIKQWLWQFCPANLY